MALDTRTDIIRLPSGVTVDLFDLDPRVCRTADDAWELGQALQEKIIEIDFQIECYGLGYWNNKPISPENVAPPLWEARAKKALAWAKLNKSDAQNRFQKLAKAERGESERAKRSELGDAFIDAARAMLTDDEFAGIMAAAIAIQNRNQKRERPSISAA